MGCLVEKGVSGYGFLHGIGVLVEKRVCEVLFVHGIGCLMEKLGFVDGPSGYAPQLANTLASCSSQAAQANPKGSLRLLSATTAESNLNLKRPTKGRTSFDWGCPPKVGFGGEVCVLTGVCPRIWRFGGWQR